MRRYFQWLCGWTPMWLVSLALAAAPDITRVEPPNWWVGHTHNPVRLLLTGHNLSGAFLSAPDGISISNLTSSGAGHYLFCDAYLATNVSPGRHQLKVKTDSGETTCDWEILPAVERTDRFAGFSPDDVIYLIMPDRFANGDQANDNPTISPGLWDRSKPRDYHGGDLQGIIDHLPYLRDLGVTTLWLTPWYDNVNHANTKEKYTRDNQRSTNGVASTDYHGYGAVDFYAVEEHFGDLAKLQQFVAAAQAAGFKVIQDQVANHTGPYHPWVKQSPTATWFNGTEAKHLDNSWQTWTLAERNPPADKLKSTLEGWFINILPDLNQTDPETATYLIQNSLWWIGVTGLDAVRQDTLPYVPRQYWARWTQALKREYPQLTILGEMFDAKPELVAFFQGGRSQFDGVDSGIDTLFDFPLYFALRDVFGNRQPMHKLAQALAADSRYVNPEVLVTFLGLHDVARFMNEPGANYDGLKLAFTFLATVRGTPMIYYGDDIGLPGGGDPDNRRDFPGGWGDDSRNAFVASGRTTEEQSLHAHVKKLLKLRRELTPLRRGDLTVMHQAPATFAFVRATAEAGVVIAFNNGDTAERLTLKLPARFRAATRLYDHLADREPVVVANDSVTLDLPARAAVILSSAAPVIAADKGVTTPATRLQ